MTQFLTEEQKTNLPSAEILNMTNDLLKQLGRGQVGRAPNKAHTIRRYQTLVSEVTGQPIPQSEEDNTMDTDTENQSAAGAETETQPAAEEKPKGKGGNKKGNPDEAKRAMYIWLQVDENPKRAGTKSAERFDLYKNGATVGDFIEAGGAMADIRWDSKHGYIQLVETKEETAQPIPVKEAEGAEA